MYMSDYSFPFEDVETNIPTKYIWYIINKSAWDLEKYWDAIAFDYDDLFQEGLIMYFIAKQTYNSKKGTFESWFRLKFESEIRTIKTGALSRDRGGSKKTMTPALNLRLCNKEIADNYGFEDISIDKLYLKELKDKLYDKLTTRQKIICEHWLHGLGLTESGKIIGITPTSILKNRQRILRFVKEINDERQNEEIENIVGEAE